MCTLLTGMLLCDVGCSWMGLRIMCFSELPPLLLVHFGEAESMAHCVQA